jgi:hypothetical protein
MARPLRDIAPMSEFIWTYALGIVLSEKERWVGRGGRESQ